MGSRRPSPYGEAVAEQLGLELARAGVVVISGLALGIDAAAHRGALNAGGVTVAVMGTGVDVIYPSAHSVLAEAILSGGGALVSQFPDGTAPRRHNFPARNYTMAALSDVVVVVEAGEGSGTEDGGAEASSVTVMGASPGRPRGPGTAVGYNAFRGLSFPLPPAPPSAGRPRRGR